MARLEKLQALLEMDPADSFTRYAIGLELAKAGKYEEAIRALEELREQDPGYVPTYYMLAGYYRKTGDTGSAKLIYLEGIVQARTANDRHAMSELQAALDEVGDEETE
jgi:predicted Zn-dependent protease